MSILKLEALADRIARGDQQAFEELYNRLRQKVYSVCLSVIREKYAAEDLLQETFVTVWTKIGSYQGNGFQAWILTVAKNKSLNALKKKMKEVSVDFTQQEQTAFPEPPPDRTGDALPTALAALQESDRQIVLMKASGMKMKEIAEFLGIPRGTASWRYSEALKLLKNTMEKEMGL